MKSALYNLIVYTHEKKRFDHFQNVIRGFIEKYPCKVIFIESDSKRGEDYFETTRGAKEDPNSSYDLFSIYVSESLLQRVPFAVIPEIIPDIPTYLVWGQNPISNNKILPELQKLATRFIFDSDSARDLTAFSSKMLQKISELKIDFMDLSWAETSGWRDVIAQAFDPSEKLTLLDSIKQVTIKYNNIQLEQDSLKNPHQNKTQAIYLQAWLASRLDWSFVSLKQKDYTSFDYRSNNSMIQVILSPQARKTLPDGKVFEIQFVFSEGIHLCLTAAEKQSKVAVYFSTEEKCELPFSLTLQDLSRGLNAIKEIFYNKPSAHYIDMLNVLKKMAWESLEISGG